MKIFSLKTGSRRLKQTIVGGECTKLCKYWLYDQFCRRFSKHFPSQIIGIRFRNGWIWNNMDIDHCQNKTRSLPAGRNTAFNRTFNVLIEFACPCSNVRWNRCKYILSLVLSSHAALFGNRLEPQRRNWLSNDVLSTRNALIQSKHEFWSMRIH